MNKLSFMAGGPIGAVLLGLVYISGLSGPTESEVGLWGMLSLGAGVVLGYLYFSVGESNRRTSDLLLALVFILVGLFQILPSMLWFEFHDLSISDGTPPSPFVAHWGYAIPHIVLLVTCLASAFVINTRR